jgi:RNA polymerase sigma-70 factor (ECF subfamily)
LEEALALLQGTVFAFSMKVCGQRQDAEDTMQEVLFKSVPNLPKFDNPRALMFWLYKVAKNRCLMSRRRSKFAPREALSLEELMPDRRDSEKLSGNNEDETPETALMHRESAKHLREAIQKLPPDYRLILVLHDMEELSDADIAEITGLRLGTIRVRLHRARLFVRKELAKQHRHGVRQQAGKAPATPEHPRERRCNEMFAELSNYLDDELDDSLCEELEKHLDGCEPCKAFLTSLEKSIQQCRTAKNESPDPRAAARLRQELLSKYEKVMKEAVRSSPMREVRQKAAS